MATYEDFQNLLIRVGTIIEAQRIDGADKLLRLKVDFGTQKRQIVSGIAVFYPDPEVLIGKQYPFVLGIPFRTIRGVESQGMILAVDPGDGSIVMLPPEKEVPDGATVR